MLPRWYPNIEDAEDGNFIKKHIEAISIKARCIVLFVKGIKKTPENEVIIKSSSGNKEYLIYYCLNKGPLSFLINPILYFKHQLTGYRLIKKEYGQAPLCHVHVMARSSLLANYLSVFSNIPFIVSEHWSGYYAESGKLSAFKRWIYRQLFRKAGKITAVSASLASAIEVLGVKKSVSIIPNVVNDLFFEREISSLNKEFKHLLHISNLNNSIKQTDKIIEYLEELAGQRNDFDLTIIGEGPDRKNLELQVDESIYLKGRVTFTGNISSQRIADFFSEAMACLLFSKFETQSVVLLESISMSVPIIAPRVGGIPEHFSDKGILFEPGSKQAFLQAVTHILNGELKLDREKMRNYAKTHFSKELIAEKFLAIYKEIKPDLNV
jgi:glycosyltransferase involved in cell wall biosynthesis